MSLLASCPQLWLEPGGHGEGTWHDLSPLSLPGEAWLGALVWVGHFRSHLSAPNPWNPGSPELWVPGQTFMGWADQQCPDVGAGHPTVSPDRHRWSFSHAPALPPWTLGSVPGPARDGFP